MTTQVGQGSAIESPQEHEKSTIELTIRTPIGDWHHDFEKTAKVSEVISATLAHFTSLEPGDYTLVRKATEETLDPHRTLVSYQIKDGETLLLVPPDGGGQ